MPKEHLYLKSLVQASRALRFASGLAPSRDEAEHVRWLSRYVIETVCDDIVRSPRDVINRVRS
jgi:hypothetical protein